MDNNNNTMYQENMNSYPNVYCKNVDYANSKTFLFFMFILLSISGIVYIEPSPYDILLLPTAIIYIIFVRKKERINIALPLVLLWLFLLGNFISLFFAAQFLWGIRYFSITFYLIIGWLFFVVFLSNYGMTGLTSLFNGYIVAAIISSLIGILSYFRLLPFYRGVREGRMLSTFKDANVLAPFLIVAIMYSLYKMTTAKMKSKVFYFSIFILTLFCVFLAFSRAAWINLICSLAFYLMMFMILNVNIRKKYLKLVLVIIIVVISAIIIYYIMNKSPEISNIFMSRLKKPIQSEIRFQRQKYVLETFLNYPLGLGPGSIYFMHPAPHNVYISVLYENGILSFLVFTAFIIATLILSIYQAIRARETYNTVYIAIASILLGLSINSLFIDSIHWRHLWLMFAIPWGMRQKENGGARLRLNV